MPTSTLGARDSNSYSCTITVDGASATVLSQFAGGKLRLRREAFGQSQCSVGIGEAFCFFPPFRETTGKCFGLPLQFYCHGVSLAVICQGLQKSLHLGIILT